MIFHSRGTSSRLPLLPFLLCLGAAACSGAPGTSAPVEEQSVKPGINEPFLDPEMEVEEWVQRFEGESREVFAQRTRVARAVGLEEGDVVADVGAGTGLFTEMFAQDVGEAGMVYAVDISSKMVEHLRERVERKGLEQVEPVLSEARDVGLPEGSCDVVFVCDTYHHFEYPRTTLASIHRALRPGGEFVVVDFERIPGVSREWILGHVRAGKEVFRSEIEEAGFVFVEELDVGLEENYFLRFRKS